MTRLRTFCVALAAIGLAGGAAVAQSTVSDPAAQPNKSNPDITGNAAAASMGNSNDMSATPNKPAMKMSPMDTKTMNSCQAMSHDAMMADTKCKALMASHPDMMNSDGTMKNEPPPH
ncbi:MAG: hypothetical protein M3T55_07475 [Pseudomonadota bacterium]|nr:hypothetical protein [Pseudomonadota bacterium]